MISGYFASITEALKPYAPISWWAFALLGGALFALSFSAAAWGWSRFQLAAIRKEWRDKIENINPLDENFHGKRISIASLATPFINTIDNKSFSDCDLVGPATVIVTGERGSVIGNGFFECVFVTLRPRPILSGRSIIFIRNCHIINCRLIGCIVLVQHNAVEAFRQQGMVPVTFTGIREFDEEISKLSSNHYQYKSENTIKGR